MSWGVRDNKARWAPARIAPLMQWNLARSTDCLGLAPPNLATRPLGTPRQMILVSTAGKITRLLAIFVPMHLLARMATGNVAREILLLDSARDIGPTCQWYGLPHSLRRCEAQFIRTSLYRSFSSRIVIIQMLDDENSAQDIVFTYYSIFFGFLFFLIFIHVSWACETSS
jgi:hypothetical protein